MQQRVEELYKIIRDANSEIKVAEEELAALRKDCPHTHTEECNYQQAPRPGNLEVAEICSDCQQYIRYVKPFQFTDKPLMTWTK